MSKQISKHSPFFAAQHFNSNLLRALKAQQISRAHDFKHDGIPYDCQLLEVGT